VIVAFLEKDGLGNHDFFSILILLLLLLFLLFFLTFFWFFHLLLFFTFFSFGFVLLELGGCVDPSHDTGQQNERLLFSEVTCLEGLDHVVYFLEIV
jgi:hypothetical protein